MSKGFRTFQPAQNTWNSHLYFPTPPSFLKEWETRIKPAQDLFGNAPAVSRAQLLLLIHKFITTDKTIIQALYTNESGELLIVASDRVSAFDWVLPTLIPNKGAVLTQISLWWFEQLKHLVPNHIISSDVPSEVAGRAVIAKPLTMYPIECVARGYLTGSGWAEYKNDQKVCGNDLPAGLLDGSKLPTCIFTPATKAVEGHDEDILREEIIAQGTLGKVYRCDLFYGNGTATLVRDSLWRDSGAGVIPDLGSHLLDIVTFWFDRPLDDVSLVSSDCYENHAPDHAVFQARELFPHIHCEMTLLSWRNSFAAHIMGENGSLHLRSLCKWGESEIVLRRRVRPSGRPEEEKWTEPEGDPTWEEEFLHFVRSCQSPTTSLQRDVRIAKGLLGLIEESQSRGK